MANGAFSTNQVSYPGSSGYPRRMYFEWGINWQNEDANQTSIWWNIRGQDGSGGNFVYNYDARVWVDGPQRLGTGFFHMTNGIFGSGNITIGHSSNGSRSFGASADGRIYYNSVNSSGSGSWWLPSLYQEIGFDAISINTVTDVSYKVYVDVNRTANLLQLSINGGGWTTYHSGNFGAVTVQVGSQANPVASGQTHSVRVRVRRASNGNISDSGTYYVTTLPQSKFFDIGDY